MAFIPSVKVEKLDILLAVYICAIVAAELLGAKTTTLFGITTTVAILSLPVTFTINDIVAEVYGKPRAQSFVRTGAIVLVVLFILTAVSVALPPSTRFGEENDATYKHFFGQSMRIMAASLVGFLLSEFLDVHIYHNIKQRISRKHLWLRNNLSNFIAQFIDTTLFMFLAFYNASPRYTAAFVWSLVVPYWLLKCGMSVLETPFLYVGVWWLKRGEQAKM